MFSYPVRAGWATADGILAKQGLMPRDIQSATLAILDSVAALTLLDTHVIVRDAAVVWRTASMLTLVTHTRPDDVERVTVAINGVSPVGRAIATATLTPFYGIEVASWSETAVPIDAHHAAVTEGPAALMPVDGAEATPPRETEDDDENASEDNITGPYQEDLGRAWYLLTNKPFVSHLCVAPRASLVKDPATVLTALTRLHAVRDTGAERARELRRDLSKDLGIDRETLVDVLADQTLALDDDAIDGVAELAQRTGLGVTRRQLQASSVWLRREGDNTSQ